MGERDLVSFLITVAGIVLGVGVGILFGAWLIQQAFGAVL